MLQAPRIGIIYGGIDGEREVSLQTARSIQEALAHSRYRLVHIEVTPDAVFVVDGEETSLEQISENIDLALLAVHGTFGENGEIQMLLEQHAIPYTGSDAIASAAAFSKSNTRDILQGHGIATAPSQTIRWQEIEDRTPLSLAQELFKTFPQPCIVKPDRAGSSIGISVCHSIDHIADALEQAFMITSDVLVEEFIKGQEATVGVISDMREKDLYALPAAHIKPAEGKEYVDYQSKADDTLVAVCPAGFDAALCKKLEDIAIKIHDVMALKDYSRSDMIIHPNRGVFVIDVNTLPGLGEQAIFRKQLESVGIDFEDFLEHITQANIPFDFSEKF